MLVAIRIRPLAQKEIQNNDKDIIRSEDKLLVSSTVPLTFVDRSGQGGIGVCGRGQEAGGAAPQ